MTDETSATDDTSAEQRKAMGTVAYWLEEVATALKREKAFRKDGRELVKVFEGGRSEETPYNILYSNTETILPAVYSATPRPNVRPRFKTGDQTLATAAAKVCQSLLEFFLDSGDSRYATFDDLMESAVVESLVPGRGTTKFKYDAEFAETPAAAEGEEPAQEVTYETVCGEEVPWDRVFFGFSKKWKDVPWMGIAWPMTREELVDNFGQEIGAAVKLQEAATSDGASDDGKECDEEDKSNTKIAWVYEIWDKTSRKVLFVSPGYDEAPLREVDDPYKLSGFFPIPRPLTFVSKVKSMVPVAPYKLYQNQAEELNSITSRITRITRALKVRGFYDSTIEGITEVLKSEDNTLLPAENVSAMLQGQTLDRAIWLVPIEQLVGVLQQLYVNRDSVKNVIFEVMGIADIMRGSSVASETLGAQQMKAQWGSMRLRRMQKNVMRYSVESLRIQAEIAFSKLSQKTIASMTGLNFPTAEEKAQAQNAMAMLQQQGQPPEVVEKQTAALQPLLQSPTWEDILGVLRNDMQRNYKIDIETNSTVDAAATEDKQDITELMVAVGQLLAGISPLVEKGIMPFEAAQTLLIAIVRKYRFGYEVEEQLKQMKQPAPPGQDPAAQAAQQEAQIKLQTAQQKAQVDQAKLQGEQQLFAAEIQAKIRKTAIDEERAAAEHQAAMEELARKQALAIAKHTTQMHQLQLKREQASASAQTQE